MIIGHPSALGLKNLLITVNCLEAVFAVLNFAY